MTARIFIDGEAGTTGLGIHQRLAGRRDIELLRIATEHRKDPGRRAELLNAADLVILCLPDDAAREAVGMIDNPAVKLIDASTAHRTKPGWVYGLPEMVPGQAERIRRAGRVGNPGCYPSGFICLVRPLVEAGLLPSDAALSVNAVSGYSGGGRSLIAAFEDPAAGTPPLGNFYAYGLALDHKHLPEMQAHALLGHRPLFVPAVGRFRQGMLVQVPLHLRSLPGSPSPRDIHVCLADRFAGARFVQVAALQENAGQVRLDPESLNGSNAMRLHVFASRDGGQCLLAAVLDNLGKGASGAAVQNMNLMLGLAPEAGLVERLAA